MEIIFRSLENRTDKGVVTFGAPWEKGAVNRETDFILKDGNGDTLPLQSRVTAYWPDGTIKWSAHTSKINGCGPYTLAKRNKEEKRKEEGIQITHVEDRIQVYAGSTSASFSLNSNHVIDEVYMNHHLTCNYGSLFYVNEEREEGLDCKRIIESNYSGIIERVEVEEEGALEAVIKVTGVHKYKDSLRIPFILRFTFHYNEPNIKVLHTFIQDGDKDKDFMKAIGITFDCPLHGEFYNRHIKIAGEEGVFHEAMQLMVSWRPRIPEDLYKLQNEGSLLSKEQMQEEAVLTALKDITIWDRYRIYQDSPRHYSIKKATSKEECAFIDCLHGNRAAGLLAVGGESGGFAIGSRNFWQKYPSSIWATGITKESTKVSAFIWSYEHEAMDYRHYDTVGHASAYYEGFDEVLSSPYGIANTNEFILFGFTEMIPSDKTIKEYVNYVQNPPLLVSSPEYYHSVKAFGEWSLINKGNKYSAWIEDQLDSLFSFYKEEIDRRDWYGLFNYGDFMHTYDPYRHCWRYDLGGYAWQNTELVPTLWLWYAFLRSGREDIFTIAEAMTRHCSEVDMYHIGELKGLGSRHNVLHWGCSCKEPRISMAYHHRFYYYLTGDYRLKDVFDDVVDADFSTITMDPLRHFYKKEEMVYETHARTGPDWSSYCSNWLTQWEIKEDSFYRDKIITGIKDIKNAPYQLISGSNYEYSPSTGKLRYIGENASGGSHLAICMGGPQIWFELDLLLEDEEFTKMLADYGSFYFASKEEKKRLAPMVSSGGFSFPYMAAAMGAFGAKYHKNEALGKLVFETLREELERNTKGKSVVTNRVEYVNTKSLEEIPWISTNTAAQWCLNAIVSMELAKEYLPIE